VIWLFAWLAQAAPAPQAADWEDEAATVLDDRRAAPRRARALRALGDRGDATLLWVVRAAAQDRVPELQVAALEVAASFDDPEAVSLMAWVLGDPASDLAVRRRALAELSAHGTDPAGEALWAAASDRHVPARLRKEATAVLASAYPAVLARRGEPKNVVDPLGGALLVGGAGVVGGIALSSIGVWGQFDGAEAIGAVGGSAVGLGAGALYVGARPATAGQGLAWASGVGWGLAAGAWTTSAVHGPWALLDRGTTRHQTATDAGAAYRLVGVVGGAGVGALWMRSDPDAWDVLEVDLAGYLGSAVALAGTSLVVWDGTAAPAEVWTTPTTIPTTTPTGTRPDTVARDLEGRQQAWEDARRPERQMMAASNLAGAGLGLGIGWALRDRWQLSWDDAAFATTLGLEAAWVGNFAPDALGIDDRDLRGTVRLPWNAAILGGLVLAEVHPMPLQTTAVAGAAGVATNGLGAGLPLLGGSSDPQTVAQVMVPVGLAGTTAGVLAAPWLDPHAGEWTLTTVGSGIAGAHGLLLGTSLSELPGGFDPDQVAGLSLTLAGATAPTLLTVGHVADPRSADMVVAGAAFGWGAAYGLATPFALRTGASAGQQTLASALTGDVFLAATSLALTDRVGLQPRHTLVPQLLGVSGATVGALGVAMFDAGAEDVVLGGLVGATTGLVGGGVVTALAPPTPRRSRPRLRLPGHWQPALFPRTPATPVERVGLRVSGW